MTKDEYGDFVLRYKGCGACFPIYHTLSRFEKMWFTAIQKDVADLEKENADLKARLEKLTIHDTNAVLKGLEMKVLKDSHRDRANKTQDQLTKAKEIIREFVEWANWQGNSKCPSFKNIQDKAEAFLNSEVEK